MTLPRYFEDWVIGETFETESRTITQADVDHFNAVEGYASRLHNAPAPTDASIFGKINVHGLVTLVIAAGLMSQMKMFDGPALAALDLTWQFKRPVHVGDTVRVRWWISDKKLSSKPGRGVIVRSVEVMNQRGESVCTGEMTALWACREKGVLP
jgi:acyl dehydratase